MVVSVENLLRFLMSNGMTKAGACGMCANVAREGLFDSSNLEDSYQRAWGLTDAQYVAYVNGGQRSFIDRAGFGLVQWTANERKQRLLAYAKSTGVSIDDLRMQENFIIKEMRERYPDVWRVVSTNNDPAYCARQICIYYEGPANVQSECEKRAALALKYFNEYKNVSAGTATEQPAAQPSATPAQQKTEDTPDTPFWPPRMITDGMVGSDVRLWQAALACHGYSVGPIDGRFESKTRAATNLFQQKALGRTGDVGPKSFNAIGIKW